MAAAASVFYTDGGEVKTITGKLAGWRSTIQLTTDGTIEYYADLLVGVTNKIAGSDVVIANRYGLYIADIKGGATVNHTNTWGIYSEGTNDKIYLGGEITANNLAGSGTRMVVASATGVLSTQTIPSGGGGDMLTTATNTMTTGKQYCNGRQFSFVFYKDRQPLRSR